MSEITTLPDTKDMDTVDNTFDSRYSVIAHNNDTTPFNDVMGVFIISCGYDSGTAHKYTMEIHKKGSSVCFWNSKKRCEEIVADFKKIKVTAELIEDK